MSAAFLVQVDQNWTVMPKMHLLVHSYRRSLSIGQQVWQLFSCNWEMIRGRNALMLLLNLDEHVSDPKSKSSCQVDEDERIHSWQKNAAQRRDDPT